MEDLEQTKRAPPGTPVLANTGVRHATVREVLSVADGCIVGSALKIDGDTWKPVDPDRAQEFMRLARLAEGRDVPGVIANKSHHATAPDEKYRVVPCPEVAVDAGFSSAADVAAAGVDIGSPVVYGSEPPERRARALARPRAAQGGSGRPPRSCG